MTNSPEIKSEDFAERPVPEWVWDLRYAQSAADEYLTEAERRLLRAAGLLLRARHGRTDLPHPKRIARLFISEALATLGKDCGRS